MQANKSLRSPFSMKRLHVRLTVLMLAVAIPLVAVIVILITTRAATQMEQDAEKQLQLANRVLAVNSSTWLSLNVQALKELVSLPDIKSMDPARQKPLLEAMHHAYPDMYLVSTTDLKGINISRSDSEQPKDYSGRLWFQQAKADKTYFQSLIGATSNLPALVVSMPIRNNDNQIVGIGMFASELTSITSEIKAGAIGSTGYAYVVDTDNRVIAHPNTDFTAQLKDFSAEPPVKALRGGTRGAYSFTDGSGVRWRANVEMLDNGWGVIVQQQESEVISALVGFERLAIGVLFIGMVVLLVLSILLIQRTLRPISVLTNTAMAITGGDLDRVAPVVNDDEIGTLAQAFNKMTSQLRELINNLEARVSARTKDLEIAADVSKRLTTELDANKLMQQVATLTAKNFNYYASFVFIFDEENKQLLRAAGSNAAGQALDATGIEAIPLNADPSVIALAARRHQPIRVQDISKTPAFLPVKSLPETRSELAIPMMSGDRLLGVFDLQSNKTDGFNADEQRILNALAEQVTIALRNAQLFEEVQAARKAAEEANKVKSQFLANMSHELRTPLNAILNFTGFVADGVMGPVNEEQISALTKAIDSGQHLLSLINDILDLTKIEVGMMDLFIQDVDMNGTMQSILSTAKGLLKGKPVELVTDIANDLPHISGDRRRIRQVLLNLVSNAAKFTQEGSITISAKHEADEIHIAVRDTGIGIAEEDHHLVFESFQQAKHELPETTGTGLGMPITKFFVEAHGGRMWFESTKGVGSTFYIVLPTKTAEKAQPVEKSSTGINA